MKDIIENIKNIFSSKHEDLVTYLNENSQYSWQEDYPIAIVHEQKRVKETSILDKMQDLYFFGDDGFSQEKYTPKMIEFLKKEAPEYIKTASLLCYDGALEHAYSLKEKFTHDKWKKVINAQNFQATIEISSFSANASIKEIETELRDLMRSRKEIPALKKIAFVWVAHVSKETNIEDIMEHYFINNYTVLEEDTTQTYIAWNECLNDINLRYFVVDPS